MICPVCGGVFESNVARNKRFCSYACRDRAYSVLYFKRRIVGDDLVLRNRLKLN